MTTIDLLLHWPWNTISHICWITDCHLLGLILNATEQSLYTLCEYFKGKCIIFLELYWIIEFGKSLNIWELLVVKHWKFIKNCTKGKNEGVKHCEKLRLFEVTVKLWPWINNQLKKLAKCVMRTANMETMKKQELQHRSAVAFVPMYSTLIVQSALTPEQYGHATAVGLCQILSTN